jgi:hypothetical protein
MGFKTYVRWAIWAIAAIVVWLVGVLTLYLILYLAWGVDFWHPLR